MKANDLLIFVTGSVSNQMGPFLFRRCGGGMGSLTSELFYGQCLRNFLPAINNVRARPPHRKEINILRGQQKH